MKSNYIKYIFIAFVVILIIFSIFKINKDNKQTQGKDNVSQKVQERNIATDLRIAIINYDNINPIISNNSNVQDISRLIYEPLITMEQDYKLQPCLATEWSISGDSSYVIKLRDNVKWHDGIEFTAKDVKFTIETLKGINSVYSENVRNVKQVDVIDNDALKITLESKDPYFEYKLNFPILSNNFYLEQDFLTTEKNNVTMGTGMYKIVSNEGGAITLKKNTNWWNINEKNPKIEEIKINLYSSMGDAYNAFKMGNLDLLSTQNEELEKYIGTIGYNNIEYKGREYDFLAMNCEDNLLSSKNVRNAIDLSIDKENIIATVYNGNYYASNFPLDFGMWLYNSEDSSSGYNPEKAKQLLTEDGWEFKRNVWQKTENYRTKILSFRLTVNSENEKRMQVAEIIKNNLEAIGIKVSIIKVSNSNYYSILENKNYQLLIAGTNIGLTPNLNTFLGENNLSNFKNEEVSTILNDIANISDEQLLKEKYKRLVEIYKNETPYKSLYINKKRLIASNNLKGEITPNLYNIFYNIENWYREI